MRRPPKVRQAKYLQSHVREDVHYKLLTSLRAIDRELSPYLSAPDGPEMADLRAQIAPYAHEVWKMTPHDAVNAAKRLLHQQTFKIEYDLCDRTFPKNIPEIDFARDHFDDAAWAASQLGIYTEQILGFSSKESGNGTGPFVITDKQGKPGNNFFSEHRKKTDPLLPGQIDFRQAHQVATGSKTAAYLATFDNYRSSAAAFVNGNGQLVKNITDYRQFAKILQDQAKFGILDGRPDPTYVPQMEYVITRFSERMRMKCK